MYNVNSKTQTIVKRLPLMAAILGAGLAMAQNNHVGKASYLLSNHQKAGMAYFEFIGASYNESAYENPDNWEYIGTTEPTSNPCTSGNNHVCVLKVDQDNLSGSGASNEEDLTNYLQGLSSASSFVDNSANISFKRN